MLWGDCDPAHVCGERDLQMFSLASFYLSASRLLWIYVSVSWPYFPSSSSKNPAIQKLSLLLLAFKPLHGLTPVYTLNLQNPLDPRNNYLSPPRSELKCETHWAFPTASCRLFKPLCFYLYPHFFILLHLWGTTYKNIHIKQWNYMICTRFNYYVFSIHQVETNAAKYNKY